MTDLILSNDQLDGLRSAPETGYESRVRWREKPGRHKQRNYTAVSADGTRYRIYQRQNLNDDMDFSCGLTWVHKGGKAVTLVRYNGSSHRHGDIFYRCHIHRAAAEALAAGRKIDSHAE